MQRGKFITLEGVDGAGKSSHIDHIIQTLQHNGHKVVSTREPGGTPLGERLRDLLLHEPMQVETEALLMFAARSEHLATLILPALQQGQYVVSDRFTDASYAYQAGAKGLSMAKMEMLESWVQGDLQPDHTLLFDVPVEVSMQRLAGARSPDKFERESAEFFHKIRQMYLYRAAQFPHRFHVINAHQSLEKVKEDVLNFIVTL